MTGRLYGVGLGPGDPELVTVKAARLIGAADVVAFHAARHGRSVARGIAAPYLRDGQIEELLVYPVTTETTDHPGGYQGAIDEFYEAAAARLAAHLDAGRDVVVLAEGDPFFYGSYMHMHKRLAHRYPTEVVPGVTSVSGAAAAVGRPLVERDEVLTVLPGTLGAEELAEWLATTDSAAVLKLGRTFPEVREAFDRAGVLDRALYVERATTDRQRTMPLADVDPRQRAVLLPRPAAQPADRRDGHAGPDRPTGDGHRRRGRRRRARARRPQLDDARGGRRPRRRRRPRRLRPLPGPGAGQPPPGAAPQRQPGRGRARRARAGAGAGRTAGGGGLQRRPGRLRDGRRGAGGRRAAGVRRRPGADRARADRGAGRGRQVGAPLGHDFCVLSLSDVLKPWDVVARPAPARGRRRPGDRALQPAVEAPAAASSARRRRCCWSTARPTPWWWSAATSAGPRSG